MQPNIEGGVEIPVEGIPEGAEGGCDAARLDTPVAYLISNAAVEADEQGEIDVAFDVAWPESLGPGGYPGVNACEARVLSEAGEVLARHVFTLSVGEGRVTQRVGLTGAERQVVSGVDPEDLSARVECEPWTSDYLKIELTPIPHPGDPRAFGQRMVLASGEVDGTPWRLLAYQSESGLCVDLEIERGAVGGCGPVPIGRELVLGQGSVLGVDGMIIHGEVSERVASVEVRRVEGDPIVTSIIPDPGGLGVNFFVAFVPRDTLGEVVALDAAGNILQSVRLRPLEGEEPPTCCREDVLDEHKVTVYYPLHWVRTEQPLIGRVEGVEEIFSVGTFAITPGVAECEDLPARAMESMGPADALVTLQEVSTNDGFGPRPRDFGTTKGDTSDSVDCLSSGEQLSLEMFTFSEGGRDFRAYVAFGSEVPEETKRSAWQVLESFLVCDPASRPGDCL